ncbi:site-2 protease family protein [Candidatus Gracilibacteria bacterium]|nr:site-2 protease family protein [Candidatus Gracilibacteria bacterium]
MSIFLGILLTLIVLLIVVMIHELGHFVTARLTGMRVEEFGIGIPPRARSLWTDKKGTEYTLNWLPIGGFVRILGENPQDGNNTAKGSFIIKPWISRVIVLAAGVTMNFVLAFVVFTGLFLYGMTPMAIIPLEGYQSQILPSAHEAIASSYLTHNGLIVTSISGSIAERAGVGSGEYVVDINSIHPQTAQDIIDIITKNEIITLTLGTPSVPPNTRVVHMNPKNGKVGMQIGYRDLHINTNKQIQYSGFEALSMGARETVATTRITLAFLSQMVVGLFAARSEVEHTEAKNMLAGPIGLGSTFVQIVEDHVPLATILVMIALLSINLGVINILPFPALDGGRIVTTTLYSISSYFPHGKQYFSRVEGAIHAIGFMLLLAFMLYVSGLDILRFF